MSKINCFGDMTKYNNSFDESLNTTISRFNGCKTNTKNVLITESVHLVAKCMSSDGLVPIESWTFPQLNRLRFPVISHKDTDGVEVMVAVQEPNSITKWSLGYKKSRIEKHFFNTRVVGVIAFDDQNDGQNYVEPIVVYETGFCQMMSNAINSRREVHENRVISDDESIQYIDGLKDSQSKSVLIIYLLAKSVDSNETTIKTIYKLTLNVETNTFLEIERQSVVNPLSNWSLCRRLATILSASHSDEGLVILSLNGKTETQLFKLNSSAIESVISLGSTSAGSVCLIGKTKDSNYLMELWESKYGSKLGRIDLPFEPMRNDCKVIDDSMYITCFKGVVLVPIVVQSIPLSQIIGKFKQKDPNVEQLEDIYEELSANNDESIEAIEERFTQIVDQIDGNIPEDVVLKFLIICATKMSETRSRSLMRFLQKLLSLPFNDIFMISKLKSSDLNFDQILMTLRLLAELLPSNDRAIIDWISILIDSHLNQFIMNTNDDTISVIKDIDDRIDSLTKFYEHLGGIKTLFDMISAKRKEKFATNSALELKPKRGQYCIEILRF